MRRLNLLILTFALLPAGAIAQVWDKFLAPGLTYRMEVDLATPRIIHGLRFSPNSNAVKAATEVGNRQVYVEDGTKSRQTMSALARDTGAIAAINGDFFPYTGDPLGLMVRNGELVSGPWPKRAIFAWGAKDASIGVGDLTIAARNGTLGEIKFNGLNQECGPEEAMVNTPAAGFARTKGVGTHVVVKGIGKWSPQTEWTGFVERVVQAEQVAVPKECAVLSTTQTNGPINALKVGDAIRINIDAKGFDWSRFDQAIGGGPFLIRNGGIAIDWDNQGFKPGFANSRHPRTAVGRTRSGEVWFVTIDGRQALSAGATLEETAQIMKRYGCVEAINLDGGGSTTFHLLGMTLNRPSDGKEREVANGVLFFGETSRHHGDPIKIKAPEKLFLGEGKTLSVMLANGAPAEPASVIWQAAGAGWIDQGGLLRPTATGTVKVTAWCEGRSATAEIAIVEKPKPPAPKKKPVRKKRGGKRG